MTDSKKKKKVSLQLAKIHLKWAWIMRCDALKLSLLGLKKTICTVKTRFCWNDITNYFYNFPVIFEESGKKFISQSSYKIMYNMGKSSYGNINNPLDPFVRPSASPRL